MKLLCIFLLWVNFNLSAAELSVLDRGKSIYFMAVGEEQDKIVVSPTAFNMNFGLKMKISGPDGEHDISANDSVRGLTRSSQLIEGQILGRNIPKQMIAFFYDLQVPGVYVFSIQLCLNPKHCISAKPEEILFSEEDFPIPSTKSTNL